MATFGSLNVSGTALSTFRTWMDAVSDNVANSATVRRMSEDAYRPRFVVATALETPDGLGAGVGVAGIELGDPNGKIINDPTNPLADADGNVRYPDVDMGDQLTQMMVAQRDYQANLAVVDRARDTYLQALRIGH